jgi:hypothetical protein
MTHPFTLTPPGIASAPAAFSSAAVGPSHDAAEAISVVCFARVLKGKRAVKYSL